MTASLERQLRYRQTMRLFAKIKAVVAGLAGALLMVASGPVVGSAKAAGAPLADEVGMGLLALGLCCLLMSGLAVAEAARLARILRPAPADAPARAAAPPRKSLEAA